MVLSRAIANNIYTICGTPSLERRYPASRNGGFTAQEYSIINGARQVGKTWIIKAFGNIEYKNMAYINCDKVVEMKTLFFGFKRKKLCN